MRPDANPSGENTTWWAKAAMNAVRLALLIFLIWALFSARFLTENPVAEDGTAPVPDPASVFVPASSP